ncbi:uncharacterized protein LOC129914098 isoform X3 [Episyrphus balteatus]|uniref:uncharacterized protein LOC129914098 isoform X3 n=1 Tax=Episyrphus balteatus TaxID=286459 RepID=UPI00248636E0|nr:uncharacterized protein LOC129914098 isoform X3 [Episyrphus balteatus]
MSSAETFVSSASPLDQPSSQPDEIGKSELQFELFLINLMKKSEPLYCSDHPDYNNSGKNRLAWLMIAEKCKKTVPQCQRKWHSLLRIYYSLPRENTWIHRSSFSEFEPYLTHNKLQNPTKVQREVLLKELLACNSELMSYESTTNENCWLKVISKCNAILPGVIMSVINWQKCWLYMKQNFGCALYTMRSRFEASIKISDKFTPEELSMIRICRATPSDSMSNIVAALGNNLELGPNRECVIFKCKKCQQQKDEILLNGYCSNCCPKPKFCNICEIGGGMVRYKLSTWSKKALDILPTNLRSSIEITVCHPCNSTLKKEATHIWKICRVCQSQKPPLESLYVNTSTTNLKKAFKDAIKFEFKEDDGLPGFICTSCISQMTKLTSFVNRFKRVQHRLYQVHSTNFIGSFYENEKLSQPLEEQEQISEDFEAILPDTDIESNISDLLRRGKKPAAKRITKANKTRPKNSEIIPVQIIPAQISTNAGDTMPITSTEPEIAIKDVYSLTQSIERVQIGQAPKLNAVPIAAGQFASEEGMQTSSKTSFPQRLLTKQNEFLNFPSKPQQDNNSMNLKPSTASKPAIFTISEFGKLKEILSGSAKPPITPIETDFESLEDEPPAFCIPKHRENSDNSIDLTSNPLTIIKDEKTDDDVDDDGNVVCTPDINIEMESTPPPPTFPEVTKELGHLLDLMVRCHNQGHFQSPLQSHFQSPLKSPLQFHFQSPLQLLVKRNLLFLLPNLKQ